VRERWFGATGRRVPEIAVEGELDVEGAKHRVIPRDYQLDPVRDFPIHVDFMRLGEGATIRVSQRGFDRDDAVVFETLDIVTEWNQLLVALDRITANADCEAPNAE